MDFQSPFSKEAHLNSKYPIQENDFFQIQFQGLGMAISKICLLNTVVGVDDFDICLILCILKSSLI